LAEHLHLYLQAGGPHLADECVEVTQAPLRDQLDLVPLAPHGIKEVAHLRECGAPRLLDVPERLAVLAVAGWHPMPHCPDLEHHHAHRMGDHVVKLSRNSCSLLGYRYTSGDLAVPLGLGRTFLGRPRFLRPLAQGEADQPTDGEQHGDEEQLTEGVGWVVEDHDCGARHHQGEADAALSAVAQVSEEHRGNHASNGDGRLVDDQLPVEEGQPCTEQPRGGRRDERGSVAQQQHEHDTTDDHRLEEKKKSAGAAGVLTGSGADAGYQRHEHDHNVETVVGEVDAHPVHPVKVDLRRHPSLIRK
jgi:hypothetical protein